MFTSLSKAATAAAAATATAAFNQASALLQTYRDG